MTRPDPERHREPPSDAETRIIRRAPSGPLPTAGDDTRTGIIRRAPTGAIPVTPDPGATTSIPRPDPGATTSIPRPDPDATGLIQRAKPAEVPQPPRQPGATTAVGACVVAMLSGWATAVVATDLIAGWWETDRLFCAAVGFLALVFAASTVSGVVLLLLRRPVGRYLIAAGSVVALLAFGGVFIAGAKIPWPVYAIPVLPVLSAGLALHPATRRWAASDHSA